MDNVSKYSLLIIEIRNKIVLAVILSVIIQVLKLKSKIRNCNC